MIIFTGDTHGDFHRFFHPRWNELIKEDYVIICGDFGGIWYGSPQEDKMLDKLNRLPFTLLFVCGNHENFDRLYQYPVKEWNGGRVREIRPHVLHLMRGEVFDIAGYKVFTMGGAKSHDIQDGILDPKEPSYCRKKKRYDIENKMYRILGKSWWPQEEPSVDEYENARRNLERNNWNVDVIVSHEGPTSIVVQIYNHEVDTYPLMEFLEEIKNNCQYRKWFFGHHHGNYNFDDRHSLLYHGIAEATERSME